MLKLLCHEINRHVSCPPTPLVGHQIFCGKTQLCKLLQIVAKRWGKNNMSCIFSVKTEPVSRDLMFPNCVFVRYLMFDGKCILENFVYKLPVGQAPRLVQI